MVFTLQARWILLFSFVGTIFLIKSSLSNHREVVIPSPMMYFIFGHAKDLSFRIFPQAQEQFCGVLKTLHESVRQQIEKRNRVYATKANKGRKHVVFQLGDWVWVHMRKERFPAHMMRINPTPSVIMPTTHWRCQLGQSQELGQRSLKKH